MDNLFIEPVEFKKEAMNTRLSQDSTNWVREIVSHFLVKNPSLQNEPMAVSWRRKDADKGYAVGSLKVAGASIPIIARQWELSPLDVMMIGDQTYPLTPEIFSNLLSKPDPYQGVAKSTPKGSVALFGDQRLQHSPSMKSEAEYQYRKVASVIDTLREVEAADIKSIVGDIECEKAVKLGFKANDTYDVVKKLARKKPTGLKTTMDSMVRDLVIDRQYVTKDEHGNYVIKQANSKVDHVWSIPVSALEAEDYKMLCAEDSETSTPTTVVGNGYELNPGSGHLYLTEGRNWHVFETGTIKTAINHEVGSDIPKVGDKGTWIIGKQASTPFEVLAIEKTAQTHSGNVYPVMGREGSLYVDRKADWHIVDEEMIKLAKEYFELEGVSPEVGDTGVWIINGRASIPFEVTRMQKLTEPGQWEIEGFDGINKISYYPIRPKATSITPHDTYTGSYYVPGNAKFVKLGSQLTKTRVAKFIKNDMQAPNKGALQIDGWDGEKKISYYPVKSLDHDSLVEHDVFKGSYYVPSSAKFVKLADSLDVLMDTVPVETSKHGIGRDDVGLFYVEGPGFTKFSETHSIRDLDRDDIIWALVHCNVSRTDIGKIAKLRKGTRTSLTSTPYSPVSPVDIASTIKSSYDEHCRKIGPLSVNLVKVASVLSDKGTVDAVLSLGLLNKKNVSEFVELVPTYESVMSDMAKLLVTTRLGLSTVPEEAVKQAMVSIADVVMVLKQLGKARETK